MWLVWKKKVEEGPDRKKTGSDVTVKVDSKLTFQEDAESCTDGATAQQEVAK